ncbi:MAG: tRNA (adenosine(37)-N6)-dimethylallyltransferase MiaA [Candidatus Kapabacteria bacterium]|jgi:tRNA dimethylallyltransferase|nr:tRNA (adenosine(37)-N6)-dimethylallyltransferase MiaA [Candidatus Kapabacteria bacterium]
MTQRRPDAIAIVGATASGKTATSLELALLLGLHNDFAFPIEIISADSRQVYRHLTIGTAKPAEEDLKTAPHHFIDEKNPDERFSAGDFGTEASMRLAEIRGRGKFPVIVGGAGLYVQALTDGFFDESAGANNLGANNLGANRLGARNDMGFEAAIAQERKRLQQEFEERGIEPLVAELMIRDSDSAEKYTDRNPRRILRALEYSRVTGEPFSKAHKTSHIARDFSTRFFGVHVERDELYKRINTRAKAMFDEGLLEETANVLAMGYSPECNALNTVGYKEAIAHKRGEISLARAIELTQQNTRHYAKRQLTWFRRDERIEWLSGAPEEIAHEIVTRLRNG